MDETAKNEQAFQAIGLMVTILSELLTRGKLKEIESMIDSLDAKILRLMVAQMLGELTGHRQKKAKGNSLQRHIDGL